MRPGLQTDQGQTDTKRIENARYDPEKINNCNTLINYTFNCFIKYIMVIELSGVQFVWVIIRFRVQFGINLHD